MCAGWVEVVAEIDREIGKQKKEKKDMSVDFVDRET